MCEVTVKNFSKVYSQIAESFKKAKFFSIDLEFSALQPLDNNAPSLFDKNRERYTKLRKNLQQVIPLQVGLTAFHFDADNNEYFGDVYNFYVSPASFTCFDLDKSFFFQASTTKFLCLHKFDFNKFAYGGIPYINKSEEEYLRCRLEDESTTSFSYHLGYEIMELFCCCSTTINQWYLDSKEGDELEIGLLKKYINHKEVLYFMHKKIRKQFTYLWTFEKDGGFFVKRVNPQELDRLLTTTNLEEEAVQSLQGFRRVFQLITDSKKPIIGHNFLQDLMIMINNFEINLPTSYNKFKKYANCLFPTIFDTKTLYSEIKKDLPGDKLPKDLSLEGLFNYFKDGPGRHLIRNSPAIGCNVNPAEFGKFHEAGWDSFCTGYIFIRIAHYYVAKDWPKGKKFMSSEIINGVSDFKNCVNVIRGSTSYIKLDGPDPQSTRPPFLVIESRTKQPIDLDQMISILNTFGSTDIRRIGKGHQVLVAVDNFRTARIISSCFKEDKEYLVSIYSFIKHDPRFKKILLFSLAMSGGILAWKLLNNL